MAAGSRLDVEAYLDRLGLPEQGSPSIESLRRLHQAHRPGGWRLDNDSRGSFFGMDFRPEPAEIADFAAMHEYLSTAPESGFVRISVVQRRDSAGADVLRGIVLRRLGADSSEGTVLTRAQWGEALADVFGLTLEDVDGAARERLWMRLLAAHEEYERSLSA
jgi:N-hydroxyarylamine O-acetyltransferase